jgi:spore germination cell wall hydrolase CwlJ-like protein
MKQCIYIVVLSIFFTLFMGRVVDAEEKEIACLAEAVYFEARSEGLLSQLGVAVVILNRAKLNSYPSNLCDVVHQSNYGRVIQCGTSVCSLTGVMVSQNVSQIQMHMKKVYS